MTKATVNNPDRTRRTTYVVLALIFLSLIGTALVAFNASRSATDADAAAKADQYVAELAAIGLRTPSPDRVVQVFGDDGGALCADPASALNRATLFGALTNGAGGPGSRPVIADDAVVKGQLLAIKVYCPEELEDFVKFTDALKYADVAQG